MTSLKYLTLFNLIICGIYLTSSSHADPRQIKHLHHIVHKIVPKEIGLEANGLLTVKYAIKGQRIDYIAFYQVKMVDYAPKFCGAGKDNQGELMWVYGSAFLVWKNPIKSIAFDEKVKLK